MNSEPNQHSTCEWVDEPYARRLWAQVLQKRFVNRASLLTVRRAAHVEQFRDRGRRFWDARVFGLGPDGALDLIYVVYTAAGQRLEEWVMLRITQHAGQRMFQRLRTNSSKDLAMTASLAFDEIAQDKTITPLSKNKPPNGSERTLLLPWGRFHLVFDDGMWIAKTFIDNKQEIR